MKTYLIITQIIYVLFLFPWFVMFGMSFMSFGMGFNIGNISFVTAIGLYPIAVLVCSILAWVFRIRQKRVAIIVNLIPMLWIISLGSILLL